LTHSATEKSTSWLIFPGLAHEVVVRFKEIWQKHGVFKSIEMLDAFRYGKINQLVDFSRTRSRSCRPIQGNLAETRRFQVNRNA
jgi:hypothetical protein